MSIKEWFQQSVFLHGVEEGKSIRWAMGIGFLLRIVPVMFWLSWPCVRDECTYLRLSERILEGEGMTASNGWIWAPGYPFFLALHEGLTGYGAGIKTTQAIVSVLVMALLFRVDALPIPQWEKWLRGCMHLVPRRFFCPVSLVRMSMVDCCSRVYGCSTKHERQNNHSNSDEARGDNRSDCGCLCSVSRGGDIYVAHILCGADLETLGFEIGLDTECEHCSGTILMVAPYSTYASKKFGSFMISDRTLGQMMWLGNNDFEPIAFDWGNGPLSNIAFERHTENGREPCASKRKPVERDKCQTKAGVDWIKSIQKRLFHASHFESHK